MKIIKATEAIPIERPVFLIYGQPGIGKTTLGYSAPRPLLLDFDAGAHRAANRGDTLAVTAWADITDLMASDVLAAYDTLVLDTVGRCLDLLTVDILDSQPKLGRDGNLTQQGWGVLKTRFRTWLAQLRTLGKHVLLLAHEREDKDGDLRIARPDIVGGSYGEVLKIADFVGYLYLSGRQRLLDFNPTDRWVGKNPAAWRPVALPPAEKARDLVTALLAEARDALGRASAAHVDAQRQVEAFRAAIEACTTAEACTAALADIQQAPPAVAAQLKKLLWARAKALGLRYQGKRFVAPEPAPALTAADIPF
jgi:hypothetical protein